MGFKKTMCISSDRFAILQGPRAQGPKGIFQQVSYFEIPKLLENSRPTACYFKWNSQKLVSQHYTRFFVGCHCNACTQGYMKQVSLLKIKFLENSRAMPCYFQGNSQKLVSQHYKKAFCGIQLQCMHSRVYLKQVNLFEYQIFSGTPRNQYHGIIARLFVGSEAIFQRKCIPSPEKFLATREKPSEECFTLTTLGGYCFNLTTFG